MSERESPRCQGQCCEIGFLRLLSQMFQIWAPIRTQNYAFLLHNLKGPARVIEHTGLAFGGITGARIMRKTFQVAPSCEGALLA